MNYRPFENGKLSLMGKEMTKESFFETSKGYGSDQPKIIFVGENYIEHDSHYIRYFGSPYSISTPGHFFSESLKEAGLLLLEECYTTTAIKPWLNTEDEMHMLLKVEIETLHPKMVVALGRKSEKMLLKVKDISHLSWFDVLPHPSYWLNFYADYRNEYIYLLKDLVRKLNAKLA